MTIIQHATLRHHPGFFGVPAQAQVPTSPGDQPGILPPGMPVIPPDPDAPELPGEGPPHPGAPPPDGPAGPPIRDPLIELPLHT